MEFIKNHTLTKFIVNNSAAGDDSEKPFCHTLALLSALRVTYENCLFVSTAPRYIKLLRRRSDIVRRQDERRHKRRKQEIEVVLSSIVSDEEASC